MIWACPGIMQASKSGSGQGRRLLREGSELSSGRGIKRTSDSKHLRERANCTVMPAQPRIGRACSRSSLHATPSSLPPLLEDIQEMLSSKIGGWEIFLRPTPFLSDGQNSRGPRRCRNPREERRMKPAANWETMGKAGADKIFRDLTDLACRTTELPEARIWTKSEGNYFAAAAVAPDR